MLTTDFNFELPDELIAQTPLESRDQSRLLCLNRNNGKIQHRYFYDIIDLLNPGDVLVLNDSRVLPARIFGKKVSSNTQNKNVKKLPTNPCHSDCHFMQTQCMDVSNAQVEFVLLQQKETDLWEVMVKPGKKAKPGDVFDFSGLMKCKIISELPEIGRLVKFEYQGDFYHILDKIGQMPLPPYITKKLQDKERYQTVYSKETGSAAAPTAGLHFTVELMQKLQDKGVNVVYVTLHVGLGTFRPVKVQNINEHKMHAERYYIPQKTADIINKAKEKGHKIIAVGTTACRSLESSASEHLESSASEPLESSANNNKILKECSSNTDIFIYPGYKFKVIDGLITNFHLPQSTLIMLVSAFAGYENTMQAYKCAITEKYRFFSFGDAMGVLDFRH